MSFRPNPKTRGITLALAALLALEAAATAAAAVVVARRARSASTTWVHHWNQVAIDASGLDHTPVAPGETRVFGEQLGPGARAARWRSSTSRSFRRGQRDRRRLPELHRHPARAGQASVDAAIAQAAHDTLAALFPSQAASFDAALAEDLRRDPGRDRRRRAASTLGQARGRRDPRAARRRRLGRTPSRCVGVDYITSDRPGQWRQDPISQHPARARRVLGRGAAVRAASRRDQFRVPPPPALDSAAYAAAYNEVKRLGGDGVVTPTMRTDGADARSGSSGPTTARRACARRRASTTRSRCRSPSSSGPTRVELARLLALVNVAMADAGIAVWESKYHYKFWRPVTGIRESDAGTGPTGLGDGNPATSGDPNFTPLGAPASNLTGPNFTPPFPAYPSGHAGFGGALFQTLRQLLRHRRHRLHVRLGRVQRRDDGQRRQRAPARSRAASRRSRRPRRRTARAASTSASTGRSTRPRASPRAGASRITCSTTPSRANASHPHQHRAPRPGAREPVELAPSTSRSARRRSRPSLRDAKRGSALGRLAVRSHPHQPRLRHGAARRRRRRGRGERRLRPHPSHRAGRGDLGADGRAARRGRVRRRLGRHDHRAQPLLRARRARTSRWCSPIRPGRCSRATCETGKIGRRARGSSRASARTSCRRSATCRACGHAYTIADEESFLTARGPAPGRGHPRRLVVGDACRGGAPLLPRRRRRQSAS